MRATWMAGIVLGLLGAMPLAHADGNAHAATVEQNAPATVHESVKADDEHVLAVWAKVPASPRGTILLVHGRTWGALPNFDLQVPGESRSVLAALAQAGYAAYALDLRGYGGTPRDASGWLTPNRASDDVIQTLQWIQQRHPQLPLPALLGYSRGSAVALLTAQRHPEALSAVVLYGFGADVDAPPAAVQAPAQPPRVQTTAKAAATDFIVPGAFSEVLRDSYVRQALANDPVRTDWRDEDQLRFTPETVKLPVLLLHGAQDPATRGDKLSRLFNRLGSEDRSWVVLPASDHAAHVENVQAAWISSIVDFLQRPR